ncbi:MAG: hypothetical protein AB4062_19715 [Crocosphaera sp.]
MLITGLARVLAWYYCATVISSYQGDRLWEKTLVRLVLAWYYCATVISSYKSDRFRETELKVCLVLRWLVGSVCKPLEY